MSAENSTRTAMGMPRRSRFARVCLLLLLWQGPFPIWHCHGSISNVFNLAEHVRSFHAGQSAEQIAQRCRVVHCHMMTFADLVSETGDEPNQPQPRRDLLFRGEASSGATNLHATGYSETFDTFEVVNCLTADLSGNSSMVSTRSFLEDFAPHLAVPVRLGVLRI